MSQECVFCNRYNRGVELGCCNTFVCHECLQGDGWNRKGGGWVSGAAQVQCPPCGVWVDI